MEVSEAVVVVAGVAVMSLGVVDEGLMTRLLGLTVSAALVADVDRMGRAELVDSTTGGTRNL